MMYFVCAFLRLWRILMTAGPSFTNTFAPRVGIGFTMAKGANFGMIRLATK